MGGFKILSIIVPTHNSQHTIKRCLNSIRQIKGIDYELIIVDDGSIDDTVKINNAYSKKYSNVYSLKQTNQGVASARNTGLLHSKGNIVCFIDSDDFIDANNLIKCVHLYYKYNDNLLVSNINFNNKNIGIKNITMQDSVGEFLKNNYPLYGNELIHVVWNKIYNNYIIKKYNIKFPQGLYMGEDLVFVLKYILCLNKRLKISQTKITYYNYSIHNNSTTNQFEKNALKSKMLILKFVKELYLKYNLSFKAINSLKIKAIYSIMLNGLKSNNKIYYLETEKKQILKNEIFDISNNNRFKFIDKVLLLNFRYMPIRIFYCFLVFISFIRYIFYLIKY